MHLNFWEIIVLLSIVQGVVLGIIFVNPKLVFYSENNKFLALSIFLISIIGLDDLLEHNLTYEKKNTLKFLLNDIPWYLLFYVPMFIYFLRSAKHPMKDSKKLWWLMIPFCIYLIFNIIIYLQGCFYITDKPINSKWVSLIYASEYFISMLYTVFLCAFSYLVIFKSEISKEEKKWLKIIWAFNVFMLTVWIFTEFLLDNAYFDWSSEITYSVWVSFSVFVFWLTFKGLYQLELAKDRSAIKKIIKRQKEMTTEKRKNKAFLINDRSSSLTEYYQSFIQLMEEEKLYVNPDLNREVIAQKLGISSSYLTQVITAVSDVNLSGIINQYRVQAAKKMLIDSEFKHFSIVAIGSEAGFKSKSSFFSSFKKEVGITPNQFRMLKNES